LNHFIAIVDFLHGAAATLVTGALSDGGNDLLAVVLFVYRR
jgi:hypothetical protein